MMKRFLSLVVLVWVSMMPLTPAFAAESIRIKDLGRIDGWRENSLVGYGLVTGLAGTGDSERNPTTKLSISNVLTQFGLSITPEQAMSHNAAIVMLSATLPSFARQGDKIDVMVTSAGDARSLLGGALLLAPLKGPDGRVYALAQGPISVGGYKYDLNGNVVQKNHPTVGLIPRGANIEVGVTADVLKPDNTIVFLLSDADYTTASRVARSINSHLHKEVAKAEDASRVVIKVDSHSNDNLVEFLTAIENAEIQPDLRARIVINERTGTVVSGGDVRISKVFISHGDLKVSVITENSVSQPLLVRQTGPDVRTVVVPNTRIDVSEGTTGQVAMTSTNNTVADLVSALTRIKTSTRDIISIIQTIKAAGALHAELIIQ